MYMERFSDRNLQGHRKFEDFHGMLDTSGSLYASRCDTGTEKIPEFLQEKKQHYAQQGIVLQQAGEIFDVR